MDSKTTSALESYQDKVLLKDKDVSDSDNDSELDEEDFMDLLDEDGALNAYRERRTQELSTQ
jgi:hypothetical protein